MKPQNDDWEAGVVGVFSRAAPTYDRIGPQVFAHFGERLVEWTRPAPNAAVLDVATGRGAVLLPAARHVGPGGRVVGIDMSAMMVSEIETDICSLCKETRHFEIRQMDAEHLNFPDASFDQVL